MNGIVEPIAFGATLELSPLIVSIGFGTIFGMVGLVLAAPPTCAAVHVIRDLAPAKAPEAARRAEAAAERPPPANRSADPLGVL